MSFTVFEAVSGALSGVNPNKVLYNKTIKYGIQADVDIKVKSQYETEGKRKGALFTNVLSPFGVMQPEYFKDAELFDGYNAQVLDSTGGINTDIVRDALRPTGRYSNQQLYNMMFTLSQATHDNHVSVMYNMLRLWLITSVLEDQPDKGYLNERRRMELGHNQPKDIFKNALNHKCDAFNISNDDIFYDDGHISVSYKDYLGREFGEEFGLRNDDELIVNEIDENFDPETMYCPELSGFTSRDMIVLSAALSSFDTTYPAKIAHKSPKLVSSLYVGTHNARLQGYFANTGDIKASEYMQVLRKYVISNRLQGQFDISYFMFVTNLFAPLPRAIEANGWISPVNTIKMPKVYSSRGIDLVLTSGTRYQPYPEAELTWNNFIRYPTRSLIHGIAACEAYFTGIFEILTATPDDLLDKLHDLQIDSISEATPMRMFLETATYRFGKPTQTAWMTSCGPDYISHIIESNAEQAPINVTSTKGDLTGYQVYQIVEAGVRRTRVRSPELRPAIVPILSMGINTDRYFTNDMKYDIKIKFDSFNQCYCTQGASQTNKALNVFRIMGYDVTSESMIGGMKYRNWAANANGHVMPMVPPDYGSPNLYLIRPENIIRRKHYWAEIIPNGYDIDVSVSIRPRGYVILASGKMFMQYGGLAVPVQLKPTPVDLNAMRITTFTVKPGKLQYQAAGFRLTPVTGETVVETSRLQLEDMTSLPQTEDQQEVTGEQEQEVYEDA